MKLATIVTAAGTRAVRVDDTTATEISPDIADVGALLGRDNWVALAAAADGPHHAWDNAEVASLVPAPGKIVCVGLNYSKHILEMGRDLPDYPTLFAKFPDTLTGPYDDIVAPEEDLQLDWEAELTVVVGQVVRHADETAASAAIAGYTVANDVSMRGYQFRTKEWLQGKMWDRSTPVGPVLVTADEWSPGSSISTVVNGQSMQHASTGDLVHDPVTLVAYLSTMITLRPGDLILTGTPGGVAHARKPPPYLRAGDVVETSIDGIGTLRNTIVASAGSEV